MQGKTTTSAQRSQSVSLYSCCELVTTLSLTVSIGLIWTNVLHFSKAWSNQKSLLLEAVVEHLSVWSLRPGLWSKCHRWAVYSGLRHGPTATISAAIAFSGRTTFVSVFLNTTLAYIAWSSISLVGTTLVTKMQRVNKHAREQQICKYLGLK